MKLKDNDYSYFISNEQRCKNWSELVEIEL